MTDSWHCTISESKRGKFRPVIKYGDTVRAIMPIQTSFGTNAAARAEGEEILNARVAGAYAGAYAEGYERGKDERGKDERVAAEESARDDREARARAQGCAWGVLLGGTLVAIIAAVVVAAAIDGYFGA